MPNPTISIVTTVYDAKDYIPRTVRSILAQSFTDFELLLVEDGSPNGCGELCDELAKTDPRIRVFHKENGGPASALNVGLDNARGDYIGFVDSDDLVDPDLYKTLLNAIRENDVRIASCNADAVDEQEKPVPGAGVNINIAERVKEIATIKVLGFYPGETAAYVFRENNTLTFLGMLVGLPLGKWLHAYVMSQIRIDTIAFDVRIAWQSVVFSMLLTAVFAAIVDVVMYFKLRRISMAESLKSIE